MKLSKLVIILLIICTASACSAIAGKEEVGFVVALRAQVRSSTAIVAADLKEVVRGDELEILDSINVPETGERWLHVRTREAEPIEGWIEARNIISQEMVGARDKSLKRTKA